MSAAVSFIPSFRGRFSERRKAERRNWNFIPSVRMYRGAERTERKSGVFGGFHGN